MVNLKWPVVVKRCVNRLVSAASITKKDSGFTLIELLVIFSVVAVLSGVGVVSLSSYSQAQQLAQSSNSIKLIIQEARSNSISSVNTMVNEDGEEISCGSRRLDGYLVRVNINLNSVQLFMSCEHTLPVLLLVKTYEPPNPLTILSATTCTDIHFDALTAIASGVPCEVEMQAFGDERSIMVDTGGNVFVN